jgi:hypothetical protein
MIHHWGEADDQQFNPGIVLTQGTGAALTIWGAAGAGTTIAAAAGLAERLRRPGRPGWTRCWRGCERSRRCSSSSAPEVWTTTRSTTRWRPGGRTTPTGSSPSTFDSVSDLPTAQEWAAGFEAALSEG